MPMRIVQGAASGAPNGIAIETDTGTGSGERQAVVLAIPGGAQITPAQDSTLTSGATKTTTRVLQPAAQGVAQDIVAIQRTATPIYSSSNNLTALSSSPYTQDTTLYSTYNNPSYASLVGHFSLLNLDILAILTATGAASATIALQRLLADGATWITIYQETIASLGGSGTAYVARGYTIGAGIAQVTGVAAGTQVISVNGTNQTFTTTLANIGTDFGSNFRWQITYTGTGAALTLFNQSLIGRS